MKSFSFSIFVLGKNNLIKLLKSVFGSFKLLKENGNFAIKEANNDFNRIISVWENLSSSYVEGERERKRREKSAKIQN